MAVKTVDMVYLLLWFVCTELFWTSLHVYVCRSRSSPQELCDREGINRRGWSSGQRVAEVREVTREEPSAYSEPEVSLSNEGIDVVVCYETVTNSQSIQKYWVIPGGVFTACSSTISGINSMDSYQYVQRYHASMGERNKVFRYLCKAIHKFQMFDWSYQEIFPSIN